MPSGPMMMGSGRHCSPPGSARPGTDKLTESSSPASRAGAGGWVLPVTPCRRGRAGRERSRRDRPTPARRRRDGGHLGRAVDRAADPSAPSPRPWPGASRCAGLSENAPAGGKKTAPGGAALLYLILKG